MSNSNDRGDLYFSLAVLAFFILGIFAYVGFKTRAEIVMCRTYYSEMSTFDCYWADKVLPQRGGK